MSKNELNGYDTFFHATPNEEMCKNGKKHDWKGWKDIKDEEGNVRGGTTVCSVCGLAAIDHSLHYGP